MSDELLAQLLFAPKEGIEVDDELVAENAVNLLENNPSGNQRDLLMEFAIKAQRESEAVDTSPVEEGLERFLQINQGLAERGYNAVDRLGEANRRIHGAQQEVNTIMSDVEAARLPGQVEAEDDLYQVIESFHEQLVDTRTEYQRTMQQVMNDNTIIRDAENISLARVLDNPTAVNMLSVEANVAQARQAQSAQKLQMLRGANQFMAESIQQQDTTRQLQNNLRRREFMQSYQAQQQLDRVIRSASLDRELAAEDLNNVKEIYGLSNQSMNSLVGYMNTLHQKKQLAFQPMETYIRTLQAKEADTRLKMLQRTIERDETSFEFWDQRIRTISSAMGEPNLGYRELLEGWDIMAPQFKELVIQSATSGQLGMGELSRTRNMYQTWAAAGNMLDDMFTPEMQALMATADKLRVNGSSLRRTPENSQTPEAWEEAKTRHFQSWYEEISQRNVTGLFDIMNLVSPVDFDFGEVPMPTNVAEAMKTWDIDTTNIGSYTQQAISAAATDIEQGKLTATEAAAGISLLIDKHREWANNSLGLDLQRMFIPELDGDGTNPAIVLGALARKQARIAVADSYGVRRDQHQFPAIQYMMDNVPARNTGQNNRARQQQSPPPRNTNTGE